MPRDPKGEKRPADVIGAAVMVGQIAIGEIEDTDALWSENFRLRHYRFSPGGPKPCAAPHV